MGSKSEKHFEKICRVCMLENENLKKLNDDFDDGDNLKILDIFNDFTVIKVLEDDGLPFKICLNCLNELKNVYFFTKNCQKAIKILTQKLQKISDDENELEIKCEISDFSENNYEEFETKYEELPEPNVVKSKNEEIKYKKKLIVQKQANSKNRKFECKKCNLNFASRDNLVAHWGTTDHKNRQYAKKICPICEKEIAYKRLRQHLKLHTKTETHVCKYCAKIYTMFSNLKRHIMEAHENVRSHVCEKCGRGFTRKSILQNHKCLYENPEEGMDRQNRKRGFVRLNCQKCDRSFRGSGALKMHQKRIHEKKENLEQNFENCVKFEQSACFEDSKEQSLETETRKILEQNFTQVNKSDIKFLCAVCGRGFSNKMLLQSHSIVHSSEKPHGCVICKKSFSRLNTLEVHMRSHTGERPYRCTECGKKFAQLTHLKYHKRTHTGERPFECQTCQKRFSLKGTLTVHLRTHTNERPYKCRFCESAFYDSSSAKKHERQNHSAQLHADFT